MGDLSGLMNKIKENVPMDQQPDLMQKISQGNFTFRIMYELIQYMLQMGPLSEVRTSTYLPLNAV